MSSRKDFLGQPAPDNYVAGLGRGATGFTTRSDLGPARAGPSDEQIKEALAKRAAQQGLAAPTAYGATEKKDDDDDDERFQDPENETGLFASGTFDRDDDEADRIYQAIDEKLEKRRGKKRLVSTPFFKVFTTSPYPHSMQRFKVQVFEEGQIANIVPFVPFREAREKAESDELQREHPSLQQRFADLRHDLGSIADEDWASIPEVGDLTGKNRRTRQNLRQRFYAVPDSVIAGARDAGQFDSSISADGGAATSLGSTNGTNGSAPVNGTATNFANFGAARDKVLQVRLDQAAQDPGTQTTAGTATNIDAKGYLTNLDQSQIMSGVQQVGDVNRARELLESVIKTNPKHGPGWIAAARLEEFAGRTVAARKLIATGTEKCPKSEDVWLERMRLNDNHNAKIIAAAALKENDRSVRLWIQAMQLENTPQAKKRVLRHALDAVPQAVDIWKEAVNLEEDQSDARMMLGKAVEMVPLSIDLWLALARLETPDNAQKVLNKARKEVPTSYEIWIAAARLQEQQGRPDRVKALMPRAITALKKENAMLKREDWIAEAERCEEDGDVFTCAAIIESTLSHGMEGDPGRKSKWIDDASSSIARGKFATARAMYDYTLSQFPNSQRVWAAAAELERNHGTQEQLKEKLSQAVNHCPQSDILWMQLAKYYWEAGDQNEARTILARAFKSNENGKEVNENIYLSASELEAANGDINQARSILTEARQRAGTDRVWVKSVAFERNYGKPEDAIDLVIQGLNRYPGNPKLWMQKGQIYESISKLPQAREAYNTGTRAAPSSPPLWILASRIEERNGAIVRARSVLERARMANRKSALLWLESVRLERRVNNITAANNLMAQALQDVRTEDSGPLWSERIMHLEERTKRKARVIDAIKKLESDPSLFVTAARIFWAQRSLEKAASWFTRAVLLDSDQGDTWAWYLKFLNQHGTDEKRAEVVAKATLAEPKYGEFWQSVVKDPKNKGKSTEELLKITIAMLD
ncbi:MAG: hypothetical protein M1820_010296 [Bogoriella megaspora]|nr:MAG: hypothetical protein M1820_010296 [Bogoriella megaspora]